MSRRCRSKPGIGRRRGVGLIVALTTLLVVMLMSGAIIQSLVASRRAGRQAPLELQANWLAEAAVARAAAQLAANPNYTGETWRPTIAESESDDDRESGVAEIRIERSSTAEPAQVTVETLYPDHPWRRIAVRRTYLVPKPGRSGP
jgi:type II secretory pathway component PulK